MSRFRERDGVLHGFGIADFADQNDIRRLPQRVLERVMPGMRVDADLTVGDERLLRLVNEFHRVLDRDDVPR